MPLRCRVNLMVCKSTLQGILLKFIDTRGGVWATCIVRPEEKGKGKKATKKRVTRQLHARFRVLVLQALTYLRIYILWIDEELFLLKKRGWMRES